MKKMNDDFYNKMISHKSIWSLMYPDYVNFMSLEEQVIEIKIEKLRWSKDNQTAYFIWGWPGPDCNLYNEKNYGKTWAFTREELINNLRKTPN